MTLPDIVDDPEGVWVELSVRDKEVEAVPLDEAVTVTLVTALVVPLKLGKGEPLKLAVTDVEGV